MAASVGLALTLAVPVSGAVQDAASSYRAQSAIDEFYRARGGQPLWLTGDPGGQALIELLQSSALDGVDPGRLMTKPLRNALRGARSGSPAAVARADRLLSEAFLTYVSLMRPAASGGWTVIDRELIPQMPPARALLGQAAASPDRAQWLDSMPWMHATYVDLRRSLAQTNDPRRAELIRINLERARFLPAGAGRHIVVNAAAQRLTMYEDGRPVDWMRVVVGKPAQPTPMMAALIRFTATNPYWNLPSDLVAERIAPNVNKLGLKYLAAKGYEVLSDWSDNPRRIDPATIDWKAVAAGRTEIRVRQKPGPANAMGRMKFMFPNPAGVYLHDTPNKELLSEDARLFSAGCVRLADAPRLAAWLYGAPLKTKGVKPETPVPLATPVPVYLAYQTAVPSGREIVYYEDIYGRDRASLGRAWPLRSASR